jgi:hypothetical protein
VQRRLGVNPGLMLIRPVKAAPEKLLNQLNDQCLTLAFTLTEVFFTFPQL